MSQSDGPRTPAQRSRGPGSPSGADSASGASSGGASSDGVVSGGVVSGGVVSGGVPAAGVPVAGVPVAVGPSSVTDVVLIHGPTEDQKGLRVLRAREQGLELGEVRPLVEGQPLTGDIVKLRPRAGMPHVCDVETQLSREELDRARGVSRPSLGHPGPARVSSDAYRTNWDAIYSSDRTVGTGELN